MQTRGKPQKFLLKGFFSCGIIRVVEISNIERTFIMNKVYLLFGLLSSAAIFAPDVRAGISLPSEKITFVHTLHTHLFSEDYLSPESFRERQEIKVAQVCWITDTDDCGGADFVGTDGTTGTPPEILPPGGDDYKESCTEMGYGKTSCPEGYSPNKFCPLDEKYFAECVQDCPSNYVTCQSPQKGVGTVCGKGLYKDCCARSAAKVYTKTVVPRLALLSINMMKAMFRPVMSWSVRFVKNAMKAGQKLNQNTKR